MAAVRELPTKEKAYNDFYHKKISEDELFRVIARIDCQKPAQGKIKRFFINIFMPSMKDESSELR